MNCAKALRVQAYFDGQLDPGEAASVVQHLQGCASCQELLADLERARATLRSAPRVRAPASLRARIDSALDAEAVTAMPRTRLRSWRSPAFWSGAFAGLGASAAAVLLVWFVLLPAASAPLVDELLTAHLHSLGDAHLISVASGDQHTVKPWFAGRADVAPTVTDFRAQGFTLAGGRVDELSGRRSAVMVYRHGAHVVNVFSWPRDQLSLPRTTTRQGYRLLFWQIDDVAYCAVSDTTWSELTSLESLVRTQAAAEQRSAPR